MSQKYKELADFIRNKMRMQHVYQPLMVMECLKRGGSASVTDIARKLLGQDVSQIEYYEQITKNMVGRVLTNNKITEKIKDGRKISAYKIPEYSNLSETEIKDLITLCQTTMDEYVQKQGDQMWAHRRKSSGYIPGTLRYEVLKRAKSRCELCGVASDVKGLEVDHIVPRNKGGPNDISNLQVLCYSCNAMKRDRDDTDFRGIVESYEVRKEGCLFCDFQSGIDRKIEGQNELCYAIRDRYPVTKHHTLIIPKRHVADFFDLYQPERNSLHSLLDEQKKKIQETDKTVIAFNVGVNAGEEAGQTIFHCHVHLIPRRKDDDENPRGGIRGVISSKKDY